MPAKLSSPINHNCMFSFLFMNIAQLYAKYRQKNKLLADYCDSSTMFICLCETFLHDGILDSVSMSVFKKKSYLQNLSEMFQLSM